MNLYKDKHIFIPIFLAFAAMVSYRAWQDMHPPARPPQAFFDTYYLVRDDAMMTPFAVDPDDKRILVIDAGAIHTGKDGTLTLGPAPVTPKSLPQREIILLFSFDTQPKELESLAPLLTQAAEKWRDLGDLINDIYLNGPKDKKSLGGLVTGVNALREAMHNDYWLGIFADEAALESLPDAQTKLEEAGKSMRTVILNAKDAQKPAEKLPDLIMRIDHSGEVPFLLQMDELPDDNALQQALKPSPQKFAGFLVDADKAVKPSK